MVDYIYGINKSKVGKAPTWKKQAQKMARNIDTALISKANSLRDWQRE